MSQRDQPTHGQNDLRTLPLNHLHVQEQISKEQSSDIVMASASALSRPSLSLFPLEHDQDTYPSSSIMLGAEDHLFANAVSSTDDGLPNDMNRYWDRSTPWIPMSSLAPASNRLTSHSIAGRIAPVPGMVSFTNSSGQTVNRGPNNHFYSWRSPPASTPESLLSPVQARNSFHNAHYHRRDTRSVVSTTDQGDGFADDSSMPPDIMDAAMGMSLNPNTSSSVINDHYSTFSLEADPFMRRHSAADLPAHAPIELTRRLPERGTKAKPYFCNYPGCDRTEGFSSESDLDRHRRTKHGLQSARRPNRSWKCQACQVDGKGKNNTRVWLRLDNFRDHCRKSHRNQNINELVANSELPESGVPIPQHINLPDPLLSSGPSSARRVGEEMSSPSSHLDQPGRKDNLAFQSLKGNVPMQEHDGNLISSSEEHWDPPYPVVKPDKLSITSQPTDSTAMVLDDTSISLLSPSSLFVNTNTSSRLSRRETIPKAKSELVREEAEHTFSEAILNKFSVHLLGNLTKILNLNQSAIDRARLVITNDLQQLVQGSYDFSEDAEGSPVSSSSSTVESGSIPSRPVTKRFPCKNTGCTRSFERQSELTKHAKRHTRPWTCIWPNCMTKKSFGSKADWKRHEGTVHWSHETYKCWEETIAREKCAKEFARGDQYKIHLKKDHSIVNEAHLRSKLDQDRQVNPLPLEYLCGFCEEMRPTISDTEEAWSGRFEHIEGHFREGLGRAEWTARGKPIISPVNHEGGSTRQGLSQRVSVLTQEEISYDATFDVMSNGSSSGISISNNNTTKNQNNKNVRTNNRGSTDEECQSPSSKRLRADDPDDDECSVASSSVSRNRTNRHRYH